MCELGQSKTMPVTLHVARGTSWPVDFMLKQIENRAFLGKYLNDPYCGFCGDIKGEK